MNRRPLILLVALYLAVRGVLLLRHFDEVAMPNFELGVMGNLARLARDGDIAIPLYGYFDNVGGHIAVGLLAVPLYALAGDGYLTLKLVPLLLGVGTLLVLFPLLERVAGRRAAWIGSALFVLAPPTLLKYSLLAKGNHFEGLFFQLLAYALFVRAQSSERRGAVLAAAGAVAGFACFMYIGSLVLLAGVALAHLALAGVRRSLADLRFAVPGFALGVAPLLWLALAPNERLQAFLRAKAVPETAFFERVGHLFTDVLPRAGGWRDIGPISARVPELLWLGAFVLAWLTLAPRLWRALRSPSERAALQLAPLWLYLPLFALVFGATTFDFDPYAAPVEIGRFRYLVPHTLFAVLLIAAAAGGARPVVRWTLIMAAGSATLASLGLLGGRVTGVDAALHYPGYHFPYFATVLMKDSSVDEATGERVWDHARVAAVLERLEPRARADAYLGVGYQTALIDDSSTLRSDSASPSLALEALLARYPEAAEPYIARGVGSYVRRVFTRGAEGPEKARQLLEQIVATEHRRAGQVIEGLCLDFGYPLELVTQQSLVVSHEIQSAVPAGRAGGWIRGFGVQCGRLLGRGLSADVETVRADAAKIFGPDQPAFWFGVGMGMSETAPTRVTLEELQARAPAEHRDWVAKGHAAGRRQLGLDE